MWPRVRNAVPFLLVILLALACPGCALKERLFGRRNDDGPVATEELVRPLMLPQAIEDDIEVGAQRRAASPPAPALPPTE